MQVNNFIQLQCNTDNTITSQDKTISLNKNLEFKVFKEKQIQQFYNSNLSYEIQRYIIKPISIIQEKDYFIMVYNTFGKSLKRLQEFQHEELSNDQFLRQITFILLQLQSLKPLIDTSNIYYLRHQPPKILITSLCDNEEQYRKCIKQFLKIIFKSKQSHLEKIHKIKKIKDLQHFLPQQNSLQQAKSIKELMQIKLQKNTNPYRINFSQEQLKWIFSSIGFVNIPKYQLIYNGLQNNFDPSLLLKNVSNQYLLYFIQTEKGQKIVFYQAIKIQYNSKSLFGNYYPDKAKKSTILGINNRTIHKLQDENNCVGYGNEILLVIGKLDIIFSAFNITNISYLPLSYSLNKEDGQQLLLDRDFKLRQLQAYKLL